MVDVGYSKFSTLKKAGLEWKLLTLTIYLRELIFIFPRIKLQKLDEFFESFEWMPQHFFLKSKDYILQLSDL